MAPCRECSENAYCSEGKINFNFLCGNFQQKIFLTGVCVCNSGFIGNGHDCRMICALDEMFNGVSCVKTAGPEEGNLIKFF